jgi:hypothetical protein
MKEVLVECLQTEYISSRLHSGGGPFLLPVYCGGVVVKIGGGVIMEVYLLYQDVMMGDSRGQFQVMDCNVTIRVGIGDKPTVESLWEPLTPYERLD